MSALPIRIKALPDTRSEVEVDGKVLNGVRGYVLRDDARSIPALELDVAVFEGGADIEGEAAVTVPDGTRATLIALGWTPPADGSGEPS